MGIEEKQYLKKRIEFLKARMVEEKNRKAKISIRNCKLMNAAEVSQHNINNLIERSRRNNILINEVMQDVNQLEA